MASPAHDRTVKALRFSYGDTKLGLALVARSDLARIIRQG